MKQLLIALGIIVTLLAIPPIIAVLPGDRVESPAPAPAQETNVAPPPETPPQPQVQLGATDQRLQQAFHNREFDLQIQGSAVVYRILEDDLDGSRHQKFLLRTSTGQSILVAHNIDLAPRIPNLSVGDTVEFYGEYEYNDKGGVIHWTHHDPKRRHVGGWLHHKGYTYQ